jgi:hypothetical protein
MYEATIQITADYGYHHYEVSSYAKNQQAISRHNFSYWQGMDFLGKLILTKPFVHCIFNCILQRYWARSTWQIDRF